MLNVLAVPAFQDNYLWLIHDGTHAAVVDPGDSAPVLAALAAHRLSLVAILLTHHHADHVGGVPELLRHFPVPVFGPRNESIAGITRHVGEGDEVILPELPLRLEVLDVPGHTLDHIAYFSPDREWLFCGDTLFAGGCGRLFEGTPAQMLDSLAKLAALPGSTQVYCAHEYTLSNLRFAQAVEPGNAELAARIPAEQSKRDQGVPTLPSTIALEKATNPFLRHTEHDILSRLADNGFIDTKEPVAAFAALRQWKNTFR